MSDENIKIIKHIQQYGHPLQGDKMTGHNQYSPYCIGGYQPKSPPKDFKIVPPNTGSNIVEPKSEQYQKGKKIYEAYQQGKQDMAKDEIQKVLIRMKEVFTAANLDKNIAGYIATRGSINTTTFIPLQDFEISFQQFIERFADHNTTDCKNSTQVNLKDLEDDLFQVGRDCIMCKHLDCIIDFEKMSEKLISLGWHKD